MKKLFTFLLALVTSVGLMWAQGPWTSGDCTLTLSGGVMTVSGNGAMADYGTSNPWKSYNSSITSIVIEDGVTHVGNGTFPQCTSLVSVVIGDDVETIGEFTFDDAGASLISVTMGNKVKSIGMAAFLWDTGLPELILSENLETIGDYAFCRMEALTTITIPSKVTSIGAAAFSNCSALQSIYIEATTPPTLGDGVFANVNADLSTIPLYVPNGSVAAYKAADQWKDFDIQGYDPAPGGGSTPTTWTSLKVGDVIKVGDKIEVPAEGDGSWGINGNVLRNTWGPYELIRADIYQASEFDDPVVTELEDGAFYVFKAENSDFYPFSNVAKGGALVVTMTSDGLEVTAAENKEFTVAVHDGGGSTPANVCGDGLTWELSDGVLTISYDGEGTGEMNDFDYEYESPVNVAPWKENKSDITTVVIGDGVKSIGNHAFNDLSEKFTAVTIANSVERIGLNAFMNAEEITEITLPSSLKTIDEQGFANCGFTSITIPSGVTSIGYRAFCYCRALTSLTCEATTPPTLAEGVFYKIRSSASSISSIPLYVPSESVAAYQAADQWNAFNVQAIPAAQPELAECGLEWTGVPEGGVVGTIGHEDEVVLPQLYATNPDFINALMGGTATVRLGSTDESVLKVLGFNNFQAIAAGECDVFAVHDADATFAYDSVAFHVTIKPAEEPATGYAEIIFIEPAAAADLAADATFGLLGTDFSVTITDTDDKLSIDANSCRFGGEEDYKSYSHRLKTGGKSSSKNFITLNIPAAGKIRIAVRTGSNGATDRNLVITQGEKELYNEIVQESQATKVIEGDKEVSVYPYVEVAVAAGTVRLTYPVGSLNFYSFGFMEDSTATGVDEIANGKSQTIKVIRDGQLLIIRDGKIYNVMGTVVR